MAERIHDFWTNGTNGPGARWRFRAAAKGRCVDCAAPREPGFTRCVEHLEKARVRSKKAYLKKKYALEKVGVFRGSQWRGNMPDTLTYHRVRIQRALRRLEVLRTTTDPGWSSAAAQRLLYVVYVGDTPWVLGHAVR